MGFTLFILIIFPVPLFFGGEVEEEKVKVAFVYNFAKFVEWPAEAFPSETSPFGICILGSDPFGVHWDILKEKTVKGRKIQIRRLHRLENLEDCHILFISASERHRLRSLFHQLKNQPILTISDLDRFASLGGMIGLIHVDGRINFEVNLDRVSGSPLKFSAQLLQVARIIRNGPGG